MSVAAVCSDQIPSNLFFRYNTDLGPPYHVLVDTNFINFSIKNKLEVVSAMMDCLLAKGAQTLHLWQWSCVDGSLGSFLTY